MADPYSTGGGGGRSPLSGSGLAGGSTNSEENTQDALDKPFDIFWPFTADAAQKIDEMFRLLFASTTKRYTELTALIQGNASPLRQASLALSNNDFNGLNASKMTIVKAVKDKIIIPIHFAMTVKKSVAGAPTPTISTRYKGSTTDITTAVSTDLANARYFHASANNANNSLVVTVTPTLRNTGLQLFANIAGPFGLSDATLKVTLLYYLMDSDYPAA